MRPDRIVLIRHGETEGNVDPTLFERLPDHRHRLTARGLDQAREAGGRLRSLIGEAPVWVYVSPYIRSRQTLEALGLGAQTAFVHEEPRLREQDWGNLQVREAMQRQREERDRFGHFYYRFSGGESGADVYDRVSSFLETMHRDFQRPDYPRVALLVTHGLWMRLFCMRWFHWSVDFFETLENPRHCEDRHLALGEAHYELDRPFRRWTTTWPPDPTRSAPIE
ncbi:MAG: histidine phosphatase family protein [Thermoleophilia bacterium]|nr:histidine phosphatase family protein [Thermoleophilia bacterium]